MRKILAATALAVTGALLYLLLRRRPTRLTRWELYMRMIATTLRHGREVACVIYSDGRAECHMLGPYGGCFRVDDNVVEIVHTHPLPRWTPSIDDIASTYNISRALGREIPMKVLTYIPDEEKLIIYEVKIRPDALPEEIVALLHELLPFEEMTVCIDPMLASELQHEAMRLFDKISITRTVLKVPRTLLESLPDVEGNVILSS